MQLSEMRRRVQNLFRDTTGAHLTNTMVADWLNDGVLEFVQETECTLKEYTFIVAAGNNTINVEYPAFSGSNNYLTAGLIVDGGDVVEEENDEPTIGEYTQFVKINRVLWLPGGVIADSRALTPVEEIGLDLATIEGNAEQTEGSPTYYYFVGGSLKIYPTPSVAGNIKLSAIPYPTTMSADSDVPDIPAKYHKDIVKYAVWMAALMDADATRSQLFRQEWGLALANGISDQENPSAASYPVVKDVESSSYPDTYW